VKTGSRLLEMYDALVRDHGTLDWWPGRTKLEIVVGAILTQNTAWSNVEKSIAVLKERGWLRIRTLERVPEDRLARAIRSSGYFRQKARKLRAFLRYFRERHGGSFRRMARMGTDSLREELLGIWGIGPETADSILLYALGRPVFVVDAYTHRVLRRHGAHPGGGYEDLRGIIEREIRGTAALYNDLHAQIVWVGHRYCKTRPRCAACPLLPFLPGGVAVEAGR